MLLTYKNVIGM